MNVEDWLGKDNVLGIDIWNKKYRHNNESFDEWLERVTNHNEYIKKLIIDKKFLFGGRILANRGLGKASLANCATLGRVNDSVIDIMDIARRLAITFKAEQGQGLSLSSIRPKDSLIQGTYKSEGVTPFMRLFDTTTSVIMQGGKRRGALLMSLDVWHKDAEDFIKIKSDLNAINNANLSLEIDDKFMNIVKKDLENNTETVISKKFYYKDSFIEYDVCPVKLYKKICEYAWKYAEPGILYTDRLFNYNLMQYVDDYKIYSTNACVTGDTLVLTDKGSVRIESIINKKVNIWNGFEWSEVEPKITGYNQEIYNVTFSNKTNIKCTSYHKFVLEGSKRVETKDLKVGDKLIKWISPNSEEMESVTVKSIENTNTIETVYCLNEPKNHTFIANGCITGNCSEQPLPPNGLCMLSSFNAGAYVIDPYTDKARFDFNLLKTDMYEVVKAMDDIVDENIDLCPLEEQKITARKYRNIGIGYFGIADTLVKMGIKYGSQESFKFMEDFCKKFLLYSILADNFLADMRGSFPGYKNSMWDSDILKNIYDERTIEVRRSLYTFRNCSLISIAPNGSIGTMLNCSTGCEPYFALSYNRRTVSMGENTYKVYVPTIDEYKKVTGNDDIPDYFVTAHDIHWKDRIEMQSIMQKYCDTAISSTCNIPHDIPVEEVEKMYMYAWEKGCKGFTCYRDGCREGVLTTDSTVNDDKKFSIHSAPKRPSILNATYYKVRANGSTFAVFVGLMENKPYEVFALDINQFNKPLFEDINTINGYIKKKGKRHYEFHSDKLNIDNIALGDNYTEFRQLTIHISAMLRHGMPIESIMKIEEKCNPIVTSFNKAIWKVLSKYLPNGKTNDKCPECGGDLIRENGCTHCASCGFSKCMLLVCSNKNDKI